MQAGAVSKGASMVSAMAHPRLPLRPMSAFKPSAQTNLRVLTFLYLEEATV